MTDDPTQTLEHPFPIALRGYDREAVDAYIEDLRAELRRQTPPATPDAAVRQALDEVGDQTARILQEAHEAAASIRNRAQEDADTRLAEADRRATEMLQRAEQRVRELDADTESLWSERARIVDDARRLGAQLIELADGATERFPPDEPMSAPPEPDEGDGTELERGEE